MNSALPNVVLISFGTVAKSSDMGPETKEAFVAMFKEFSNVGISNPNDIKFFC